MTLDQLRFFCEIVDQGFSISRAADSLRIAQPWVSRHIAALEQEVGTELLRRYRNRVNGLTDSGEAVLALARRVINDARSITRIGSDIAGRDVRLVIATTHFVAGYLLPPVVQRFRREYPNVQLGMIQANSDDMTELLLSGRADMGIGPERPDDESGLVQLTCCPLVRGVLTPVRHPLLRRSAITLLDLARYPIISYDAAHISTVLLNRAFDRAGVRPNVVINAPDTEVVKAYVKLGLGLAVIPKMAFDPRRDRGLRMIDAAHLFEQSHVAILLRPGPYIAQHVCDLACMLEPKWTPAIIRETLVRGAAAAHATAL
jgi:LysR family cys regulon transcriptional activator